MAKAANPDKERGRKRRQRARDDAQPLAIPDAPNATIDLIGKPRF